MLKLWSRAISTPSVVLLGSEALLIASVVWGSFVWQQTSRPLLSGQAVAGVLAVVAVCLLSLSLHDLYVSSGSNLSWRSFLRIVQSIGVAALIVVMLMKVFPASGLGDGVFMTFLMLPFVLMTWRWVYEHWVHRLAFDRKVFLVGSGRLADALVTTLNSDRDHAYDIAGRFQSFEHVGAGAAARGGQAGPDGSLLAAIRRARINSVVVALDDSRGKLPIDELLRCKFSGIRIEDGLSFYERVTGKIHVDAVKPSWLIFSDGFARTRIEWLKRCFDVTASLTGLLVSAPLWAVIAVLIKADSRGPVFYRQERVGLGGVPFVLFKFRSMRQDAEAATGPVWATDGDERATRVGKWLRALRLDELPQMINVLRGDMSFVGPRPERPCFVEDLTRQIPYYGYRHAIKPGITGWAQVRYRYGASVQDSMEKLQYDLYYIKNLSLVLDATIIANTLKIMLLGRGAR
jgi:sugar transferase (PEP-CTERM system associated)